MTGDSSSLPPIRRTVSVSWDPATAFHRFTAEFGAWWPTRTHSIGGARVRQVIFECREGGRIIEELDDGRRFQWGRVTAFDPGQHRVAFTWHPSRDESEAQDVEVRFLAADGGTLVELVSHGWERLGRRARRERRGYEIGWGSVLEVFAGRKSAAFVLFALISGAITLFLRATGRLDGAIARAGGRIQ